MSEPRLPELPLFPPNEPIERWRISHDLGIRQAMAGDDEKAWVQHRLALRLALEDGLEYAAQCSRIEIARTTIQLGMVNLASTFLADLLVCDGLDREQQYEVNWQLAALFAFEEDWEEALVYWGRARALIQPGEVEKLFWSHLLQCHLLVPTDNLVGANRELHLARCFAPLNERNRERFSSLISVRTAEIYRSRGDLQEALAEVRKALNGLEETGTAAPRPEASVLFAEVLVEAGSFQEAVDFITTTTTDNMSYRQRVRLTEARAGALKELGMWREASVQLAELIKAETELETDAHTAYTLQEAIESSRETRVQNQHLAQANELLVESNEQRAQLMDIIRRDLQTQLRSTVDAWRDLESSSCTTHRSALLDKAERSVDRLSATAVQVVEMRLSDDDAVHDSGPAFGLPEFLTGSDGSTLGLPPDGPPLSRTSAV